LLRVLLYCGGAGLVSPLSDAPLKNHKASSQSPLITLSIPGVSRACPPLIWLSSEAWSWHELVVVENQEPLSEDILRATTQRETRSYYPKRYWELLPKEILGAITQRGTGSYYPKRDSDVLWENRARSVDLQGGRCMRVFGYKEVTRRCLEALELKGGDGGACKLLGDVIEVLGCLLEVLGCLKWVKMQEKGCRVHFISG
ncbi:hypothetical protein Tco_1249361, partial [Tanacetum coccineum]